ncbi:MAG: DNA polymerase III subunit delta' [Candidatus Omnitrophica bacterium]|nr:DNA polymerase III subunit delta' [Candidatus Omnitrophota bacterium]
MAWAEIIGHEFAKRLLQTHLAEGAVPGAYLFAGPDGVGKRRVALEMVKALNCAAQGPRPCDACPACRQISRGAHPDVHLLAPGGASQQIRIDEIRHVLGRLALRPFSARIQAALIDGAERLTEEAANSLLKALEEPSARARFFLTTARLSDCLPTIVSRCQLIRCRPLPVEAVARLLREQGVAEETAEAAARLSGGSVSQALELAGRWPAYRELAARLADRSPSAWLEGALPETRQDVARFLDGLMDWLRDVAVTAAGGPQWVRQRDHAEALRRAAAAIDLDRCLKLAWELVSLRESVDQFVSPRLVASLAREKWLELQKSGDTSIFRSPERDSEK